MSVDFEVVRSYQTGSAYGDQKAPVNIEPVAFFGEAKLTTSSRKHLEKIDNLHNKILMHKLRTSQQQQTDLMFVFEESETNRRQELKNNKQRKEQFCKNYTEQNVWIC